MALGSSWLKFTTVWTCISWKREELECEKKWCQIGENGRRYRKINGKWVNKMRCDWLRRELISGLELWRHSCRAEEPQGGRRDGGRKYTERDERKPRSGWREVRMRILADRNLKLVIGEFKGWGGGCAIISTHANAEMAFTVMIAKRNDLRQSCPQTEHSLSPPVHQEASPATGYNRSQDSQHHTSACTTGHIKYSDTQWSQRIPHV